MKVKLHNLHTLLLIACTLLCFGCQETTPPSNPTLPQVPTDATNSWIMSSMSKVSNYKSESPQNKVTLHLAKGEAEHIQLVLETPSKGRISVSQTLVQEGISFDVREIKAYENEEDVLAPIPSIGIETRTRVVKLWLTCETSTNVAPGEYSNVLTFSGSAGEIIVGVTLKVYDVTIPITPSIPAVFGINPAFVSSATGEKLISQRKAYADALLSRRATPYFCQWWEGSMRVECFTSPYAWSDPRSLTYMDDPRLTHLLLPYHALTSAERRTLYTQVKQQLPQKQQLFYIWDEPTKTSEYEHIKTMASNIHATNPDAQIITTFFRGPTDPNNTNFNDLLSVWNHLDGATSVFCTGVWSLQQNENRSAQCLAKCTSEQEWWTYVCMGDRPGLAHSSTPMENRAVQWRNYKEQSKGFLYWSVNAFSSLSPLRPRSELPQGDGTIIYPGEAFGSDEPLISMRLERWRDGAEDYELLLLLEKKTSRSEALSLLNNIYKGASESQISANPTYIDNFKIKILQELTK